MSTLFFRNPRLLALTLLMIVVAGLSAFQAIPRLEDPVIVNRFATVITNYPGASAERVESLVTEPIEDELRKLSEIKNIFSTSANGLSFVRVELKDSVTNVDEVWSRVRDKLSDIARSLPTGAADPTFDDDRTYAFTMIAGLVWTGQGAPNRGILRRYAEDLQTRLRNRSGTAFVKIYGAPSEEIRVVVDPTRMASLNLTAAELSRAITSADAKVSAGQLRNGKSDILIEVDGALTTLDRIRRIPVRQSADGRILRLGDIAKIERTTVDPPRELAAIGRRPAVLVAVRMEFDRRVDQWSASVRSLLSDYRKELPQGIALNVVFDQNTYTDARLSDLLVNLLMGAALVVVVLFVTLGWRNALVVAATLPLTSFVALAVLNIAGIPIHQMSVTGLIVALGLLVDNAIVMVDSIRAKRGEGASALEAIDRSVRHLWVPLLASTVTTILAFMPIVLLPGPTGEFVGAIGISVIVALVTSYLLSLSVIPALTGLLNRATTSGRPRWWRDGASFPRFRRVFEWSLAVSLRNPRISLIAASFLPVLGFVAAGTLTEQFFPPAGRDQFHVEIVLPRDHSIRETQRVVARAQALLEKQDGIEKIVWSLGTSAPSFYYNLMMNKDGQSNYAQALITARSIDDAERLILALQDRFDRQFPGARILVRKLEQGPPFEAPIELRFYGPDLRVLKDLGEKARAIVGQVPTVIHTNASLLSGQPKLWFQVDEEKARLAGLTLRDVAGQLELSLEGVTGGSIVEGTEVLPVRIRVGERHNLSDILSRRVTGSQGAGASPEAFPGVPLSALGTVRLSPVMGTIPRRNGERVNTVQGYLRVGILPQDALNEVRARLAAAKLQLPPGYRLEFGGESEKRNESVGKLMAYVGLIMILMITVVVLSFNSFRFGTVIFIVAGQSFGLGLLSLAIFNYPLGFVVIIGLMGLIGLAINAAIIITAALKADPEACTGDPDRVRHVVVHETSRHIVSTTITTVGGFLPLILAEGGFWPPFAIAIAGGTLLSTVISFYFVPAAFLLIVRRDRRRRERRAETTTQVALTAGGTAPSPQAG